MAFTLYASGRHTFDSLRETLTDAGLRTRPSKRFPAGTLLSIHRLSDLLRDRYYLGYVTHDGVEYKGRHQALVTREIFDQVQAILAARTAGASREREHQHYLKGTVWCNRCKRRLTMNRARGRHGGVYFYFLCRGRQDHTCDLPHLPVHEVEDAAASTAAFSRTPECGTSPSSQARKAPESSGRPVMVCRALANVATMTALDGGGMTPAERNATITPARTST